MNLGGEKMSKSLGNVVTIRKVAETHDLEALRLLFLGVHYRSPVGFRSAATTRGGPSTPTSTKPRTARLLLSGRCAEAGGGAAPGDDTGPVVPAADKTLSNFQEAMDDDFNTAAAIGHLYDAFVLANKLLDEPKAAAKDVRRRTLARLRRDLLKCGETLGIFQREPAAFLLARRDRLCVRRGIDAAGVEGKIQERTAARAAKDFARADEIREGPPRAGDRADGRPDRHDLARGLRTGRDARGRARRRSAALVGVDWRRRAGFGADALAGAPLLTRSRSSLPTLKKASRLGRTWTASPVRGLRPWYSL